MTLLCTCHHRRLHEGGFSIEKEADETLRFVTADGRTIPRCGYRLEDFVDDDVRGGGAGPSAEGFWTATVHRTDDEVREPAMIYQIQPAGAAAGRVGGG
jgi:hypothetical protein